MSSCAMKSAHSPSWSRYSSPQEGRPPARGVATALRPLFELWCRPIQEQEPWLWKGGKYCLREFFGFERLQDLLVVLAEF